jgi:phosphoenolpyruvate-protein phosphotransferase (PTS system enzyme I)
MERDDLPSEDEQYEAYSTVARAFGEKPVIIRTLDVGGDKDLPGVDQAHEENPFLGWRGIRMSLDTPELFEPQLRAILRAAADGNLKIMFPMVADVGELKAAKARLLECRRKLNSEGVEFGEVEAGVMIETPAAALCAAELAEESAFFSIGTNDLVQYTLAADRGNERLRHLQNADHPAVLALIQITCEAASAAGIQVGVCGEAAGEPEMIPRLVELGVTELSMAAPQIPRAKKVVSEVWGRASSPTMRPLARPWLTSSPGGWKKNLPRSLCCQLALPLSGCTGGSSRCTARGGSLSRTPLSSISTNTLGWRRITGRATTCI